MHKKSKKQPYKNTLLKLKKERSSLDLIFKENQRLKANLLYKQKEAQQLLNHAAREYESAERIRVENTKELRSNNPYHPMLSSSTVITNVLSQETVLHYRMTAPRVYWDDEQHQGSVRLVCHKQDGQYETLGYSFSTAMVKQCASYISEEFVDNLSKDIAMQLTEIATKTMKEW